MNGTRTYLRVFFVLAAFGLLSLFAMLGRPTVGEIRAVDLVHLIGTGMCLGGALVALGVHMRDSRPK